MTPRHPYKLKSCEVCGRDYYAFPQLTRHGRVSYRSPCKWCGAHDFARAEFSTQGHLEIPEHTLEAERHG